MNNQNNDTAVVTLDPKIKNTLALQDVAKGLFGSGLFPSARNEFGVFAIIEYGRELGIDPMMALQNINIIGGKLACNSQLMLSKAIEKGVTYKVISETDKGCTIEFKRGETIYTSEFNEGDATAAGLLGKDNWKKHPRDMYFWRAAVKGIRRIAPDAIMGLYSPEELTAGNMVDTDFTVVQQPPQHVPYVKKEDRIAQIVELEGKVYTSEEMRNLGRLGSLETEDLNAATVKALTDYHESLTAEMEKKANADA
jgi:hypothetical protein